MNAVVTIAVGEDYKKIAGYTHATIRGYAEQIGAEFVGIGEQKVSRTTPHWEKFQMRSLLDRYERIIYLDTDLIVRDDCPSLFDIVPEDKLGAFNEAPFTDRSKELLIETCKTYGVTLSDWDGRYYNTGVMVVSQCHKELFMKPEVEDCNFYEQSYLNMRIAQEDVKVHNLHYRYNRMTCMDAVTGEERFASYVIHYAGYPSLEFVLDLIPRDIRKWEQDSPNYFYKRHILVNVSGGLGDQICAEPAVRFMIRHVYPDDDVRVVTHWPRIFSHLELPVYEHGRYDFMNADIPFCIRDSLPGPETVMWRVVSNLLCHTVDYCSMAILRRILPDREKRIKLLVDREDLARLGDIAGTERFDDYVLVHAGKHWETKTIPKQWWQDLVDGLTKKGLKVCLIGKDEGTVGVWDIDGNGKTVDLRNRLDLGELFALISKAGVLVTNDSAPLHIAGAFDNWIVLVPTCKHPDHILPYRHDGKKDYRAKALYKKLTIDDVSSQPTEVYGVSGEFLNGRSWGEYLPEVGEVVEFVDGLVS